MDRTEIQSDAYRQATLRSERIRVVLVIFMMVAISLAIPLVFSSSGADKLQDGGSAIPVLAILFGMYELLRLRAVGWAIRQSRDVSRYSWWITAAVEAAFP